MYRDTCRGFCCGCEQEEQFVVRRMTTQNNRRKEGSAGAELLPTARPFAIAGRMPQPRPIYSFAVLCDTHIRNLDRIEPLDEGLNRAGAFRYAVSSYADEIRLG